MKQRKLKAYFVLRVFAGDYLKRGATAFVYGTHHKRDAIKEAIRIQHKLGGQASSVICFAMETARAKQFYSVLV